MADATLAQIGSQVTLSSYNDDSPPVFTNLGPIRSIAGIGVARPEVESTTLDSLAVERIGGLPDGKQVTIVFTMATSNLTVIEGFVNDGDPVNLRVTFPAPLSTSRYFTIAPLDFDYGTIQPSGLVEITLIGRISGPITTTP